MLIQIARYAWAAPCSVVGLLTASLVPVFGGTVRRNNGVLEVSLSGNAPVAPDKSRFSHQAVTLGHVIIGRDQNALERLYLHEREHVRQYERWGLFFFLGYPLSSLIQLLRGRNPYWHNHFEVQARGRNIEKTSIPK